MLENYSSLQIGPHPLLRKEAKSTSMGEVPFTDFTIIIQEIPVERIFYKHFLSWIFIKDVVNPEPWGTKTRLMENTVALLLSGRQ